MRAANDPIRHDDGFDCMRLDHRDNLTANSLVKTHITPGGEEPLQDLSFFVFSTENGHRNLGRKIGSGSIKRDGRDGIPAKATVGLLFEMVPRLSHHIGCQSAGD